MALIICPECGKEISDQAKVCIHCGYPIAEKVPEDTAAFRFGESIEEPAPESMDEYLNGETEAYTSTASRKKWIIIGGVILAAAIVAAVLLFFVFPREGKITTFGLKADMGRDEIVSAMEKQGFTLLEESTRKSAYPWYAFIGKANLYGADISAVLIEQLTPGMTIKYIFWGEKTDPRALEGVDHPILHKDLESVYQRIYNGAVKQLGEPKYKKIHGDITSTSITTTWKGDHEYCLTDDIEWAGMVYLEIYLRD